MPRLHRYLPPLLTLLPVIFICGKLLLTPVSEHLHIEVIDSAEFRLLPRGRVFLPVTECGWPWAFRRRTDLGGRTPIDPTVNADQFFWSLLLADIAIFSLLIWAAVVLLDRHQRCNRAWLRFSLREFLFAIAIFAALLGWAMHVHEQWKREQDVIRDYAYLINEYPEYCGPEWLRRLWPEEDLTCFQRVTSVRIEPDNLSHDCLDSLIVALHGMPYVIEMQIGGPGQYWVREPPSAERRLQLKSSEKATDLSVLGRLNVRCSWLNESQQLAVLQRWSPALRTLEFEACDIHETISQIESLTSLEELKLSDCNYSNGAIFGALSKLARLKRLTISRIAITDETIDRLLQLSALEELSLDASELADPGVRRFAQLPNLSLLQIYGRATISEETVQFLKQRISHLNIKCGMRASDDGN